MHWSDGLSEEELRRTMRGMSKTGVLQDGGSIRVKPMMMDSAPGRGLPGTDGMSLRDVATAVSRGPMPSNILDCDLKRETVRCRLGDSAANKSDQDVDVSFATLVAISAGELARHRATTARTNAWRHE